MTNRQVVTGQQYPSTTEDATAGMARLKACPGPPNCVSSMSSRGKHTLSPLSYISSLSATRQTLIDLLKADGAAKIVVQKKDYIHVEFRSKVFGFTDDVEFLFSPEQPIIHVRSASRVGYYDFGANRKRIERLRRQMTVHADA